MKHPLTVAISLNTTDPVFQHDTDRGSSIEDRMMTLKELKESGIRNILFMSPIFPLITHWKELILRTRDYIDLYWLEDLNLRGDYKRCNNHISLLLIINKDSLTLQPRKYHL